MKQRHTVVIERPAQVVFNLAEDPKNAKQWAEGVVDFEILEGAPGEVGTTYRMTVREGRSENVYDGVIVAWEDGSRTVNRLTRNGTTITMTRRYAPIPQGTRLTMTVTFDVPGAARLMTPIIWLVNRHFLRKQARALKALVERETAA